MNKSSYRPFEFSILIIGLMAGCGVNPPNSSETRADLAAAMFQERCMSAGEKIYKTIEDIDGIYLLNVRPKGADYSDQYMLIDPYGRDLEGDAYIKTFLKGYYQTNVRRPEVLPPNAAPHIGYQYVEVDNHEDQKRYRYTGRIDQPGLIDKKYAIDKKIFVLDRSLAKGVAPRYAVMYTDISTPLERSYWLAGSSLKIIDTEKNEVIAERIGYMFDAAQGNTSGGRMPWLWAANHSCPSFGVDHAFTSQLHQTETFVGKVLHPRVK